MWDYDSLIGKAKAYFERAQQHAHSDDDEFAIWNLLGLEFLIRAPLARFNPALLAAPEGDSIMHALGIDTSGDPRSVQSKTVVARLGKLLDDFGQTVRDDTLALLNLRNSELHSGDAAVANAGNQFWLPKLIRTAEPITNYLGLELADILGDDIVTLGRALVDAEDKKLAHVVAEKIEAAKEFLAKLTAREVEARKASRTVGFFHFHFEACPACGHSALVRLQKIRETAPRLEGEALVNDVVYVSVEVKCPVCELELSSTAEIRAAGLPQQRVQTEEQTLEELYQESFIDYDYGND